MPDHTIKMERVLSVVPDGRPPLLLGAAVLAAVLVMSVSFFTVMRIHDAIKSELQVLLGNTLAQTVDTLHQWVSVRTRDMELWATTPDVVALTGVLTAYGGAAPRALHRQLSQRLMPALKAWEGSAYTVVGLDGQVLTSSEAYEIGHLSVTLKIPGFMDAILAGRAIMSQPMFHPKVLGVRRTSDLKIPDESQDMLIYVGAPIHIEGGGIIGVLVFELDPAVDFFHILAGGRVRKTMETITFSANDVLLNESRFADDLARIGLIKAGESSALKVTLRDPGRDLRSGNRPLRGREHQPLTVMAKGVFKHQAGINLDGYRSYMGHEVVGTWRWDRELGFGIATEMSADEAFSTFYTARLEILLASLLAAGLLVGLGLTSRASRKRENENARRIQAILSNVADAIILIDAEGYIETFNPAAERIFGYHVDDIVGRNVKILMPEPDRLHHDGYLRKFLGGADHHVVGFTREVEAKRKDGTLFPMELGIAVMKLRGRQFFLGTLRDITDQKNAKDTLRRSSESLKTAQRIAKLGGWSWEFSTGELAWSDEVFRIFGYLPQEFSPTYEAFLSAVHPDDRGKVQVAVDRAIETKSTYNIEHRVVQPNGQVRVVHEQGVIMVGLDGKLMHMDGIVHDITERKEAERLKSEFVSTVSHELRTPLTSILGALGLLDGGVASPVSEQGKELIKVAHQNSARLVRLIDDILDIEKLEADQMVFDRYDWGVDDLLAQAVEASDAYAGAFGVVLSWTSSVPARKINVDADRFAQVMANLISNAVKFSPEGGSVTVDAIETEAGIRFSVTDCGPGIPKSFHPRLFQHFTQADSSDTRQKGGTGLGLSISKVIVECLGGTLEFLTDPRKGSTFYFVLPSVDRVDR